jgi:pimeloyl-ACP methyl ester carboxylesterase
MGRDAIRLHTTIKAVAPLTGMTRRTTLVDGHRLTTFEAGRGRESIVLIHGIPDSSAIYRRQIPTLIDAGYRVIVPDLLGHGDSEMPPGVEHYTGAEDERRMWAVLRDLGVGRMHIVGHDRGALLSWGMAAHAPDRVISHVALSVGHPNAIGSSGYDQKERSWYQYRLLLSDAEDFLRGEDEGEGGRWSTFRWWMRHHPECDTWVKDLERPGALTAMLNFYRANLDPTGAKREPLPKVLVPTLGVWPAADTFNGIEQMVRSSEWMEGPWRFVRLDGASTFLQLDRPRQLAELILEHVRQNRDEPNAIVPAFEGGPFVG